MPGRALNPSGTVTFSSHKSVVQLGQNHSLLPETLGASRDLEFRSWSFRDRRSLFPSVVWGNTAPDSAVKGMKSKDLA